MDPAARLERLGVVVVRRHPSHTVMRDQRATSSASSPALRLCRPAQPGDGAYQLVGIGMPSL
jgi:hypothetical protein